jgi:hypothetical protein
METNSYVEDILIRERIAEAHRAGARRQLLRSAGRATTQRRRPGVIQYFVEAISILWVKGRKERMAVR